VILAWIAAPRWGLRSDPALGDGRKDMQRATYVRLYADEDGASHFEDLKVDLLPVELVPCGALRSGVSCSLMARGVKAILPA
jgi:hypothetical protein